MPLPNNQFGDDWYEAQPEVIDFAAHAAELTVEYPGLHLAVAAVCDADDDIRRKQQELLQLEAEAIGMREYAFATVAPETISPWNANANVQETKLTFYDQDLAKSGIVGHVDSMLWVTGKSMEPRRRALLHKAIKFGGKFAVGYVAFEMLRRSGSGDTLISGDLVQSFSEFSLLAAGIAVHLGSDEYLS